MRGTIASPVTPAKLRHSPPGLPPLAARTKLRAPPIEPMPLSSFQPAVRSWFAERLGDPTPPQLEGWPAIQAGKHTLIAAPTGSGKTLAAFLSALDGLLA